MAPLSPLPPSCQGLISCLHSSCDEDHAAAAAQDTKRKTTKEILCYRIVNIYEEAFSRLPLEDMPPDVLGMHNMGSLCVGLLGPVSNIILNAVSLLPPDFRSSASPRASKSICNITFHIIASASYLALVGFMLDYFGCLTEEQAGRYLRWADADLALAVLLVEYDLYTAGRLPHPGSGRTQASLKSAMVRAGHPAPDRLVQLAASVFPPQRLEAVKPLLLAGGRKLTVDDVHLLQRLLQDSSATSNAAHVTLLPHGGFVTRVPEQAYEIESSDLGDGYITTTAKPVGDHISSLRSRQDMDSMQSACLEKAYSLKNRPKECCGELCEHLQLCPLPVADHSAQYDILDTMSILRTEVRSLEGMMEAVRAMAPAFSTKDIVKSLCLTRCDITQMWLQSERSSDPFLRAAVAAQHPMHAALALFHKQLVEDPAKLDNLRLACKTKGGLLSPSDIDQIAGLVDEVFKITPEVQHSLQPDQVPQLHKDAASALLTKRSEYEVQSKFIRSKIAQLLDNYAAQHPWEQNYVPVVICGVEKCGNLFGEVYRVNFIAGSKYGNTHEKNTLFFAEFWELYRSDDSKQDICCPLNPPYTGGRCYYGKSSARKIVYPDSAEYFMCDVTAHGIGNVDNITDADLVYFDSERDAEFVKKVNSYYAENSFLRPTILATNTKRSMFTSLEEFYPCS
ncbi:unnamed protein product [Alopecurus aequalis]